MTLSGMRCLALLLLWLAGCAGEEERALRWELSFPSAEARSRTIEVEARIVRGGCDGDADAWSGRVGRDTAAGGMLVGPLSSGRYGFAARALDDSCTWFLAGCVDVDLPRNDRAVVSVPLLPADPPVAASDCGARCPLPRAFDTEVTWQETLFVSPTGDDTASGTRTSPLATMAEAAARARRDVATRIVLLEGTHVPARFEAGELVRASAATALKIEGEPGAIVEAPVDTLSAIYTSGARWFVLEDLTLQGGEDPLRFEREDATINSHVVLRNLTIRDADECIRLYAGEDVRIDGVDVSGCNFGVRLLAVHDSYVVNSTFRDAAGWGVSMEGASIDILVHGNVFRNLNGGVRGGGNGVVDFWIPQPPAVEREGTRIYVVGNVFENVGTDYGQVVFDSCDACVVANNTMIDPQFHITRLLHTNGDPRVRGSRYGAFVNNLIVFDVADVSGYANLDASPEAEIAADTFLYAANLFVPDDPAFDGFTLPAPIPPDETSRVVADAGLRDVAAGDYHLSEGSPAVGAGTTDVTFGGFAPGDFDSACWASPPAIGAFEVH